MLDLPTAIITVLRTFAPVFSEGVWEWAKILLVAAILAPGKRTVTSALRVMGLSAVLELLATCVNLRQPLTVVTRLRLDATLYDPARQPGQRGAPRKKGERQPTLAQRISDLATTWQRVMLQGYGNTMRTVEVASGTAVWYHSGLPIVPLRWVLIRDPLGKFTPQALLCTDLTATSAQIVAWFVLPWQLEVTFEEARTHLGIETQRQWSCLILSPLSLL
jgi:hypothetical protein